MGDNRKTLRSFYCRDYLWELFEVMTQDLGCSMDYLINESMRHYARSRNYTQGQGRPAPSTPPAALYAAPSAQRTPPPLPMAQPLASPAAATLYLIFNGQSYRIEKEHFIIGRGNQGTDLMIRDSNISRKHCAISLHDGQYYIRDLDSTNGVEFGGQRVEQKLIEEGDVYYLCDYELRFTYR